MQAQAMHAAAANAAWNQSNNPYLSGLCFPYNLYGAAGVQQQQLYAAYARSAALSPLSICLSIADKAVLLKPPTFARSCYVETHYCAAERDMSVQILSCIVLCSLAPQASPWGTMDGGAAGNLPTPAMSGGQAGSNPGSAQVPTSQPAMTSWGLNSNGVSPGDSSSLHPMQQWMPSNGRSHSGSQNGAREMAGAWQQWPAHGGELAMAAEQKVTPALIVLTSARPLPFHV